MPGDARGDTMAVEVSHVTLQLVRFDDAREVQAERSSIGNPLWSALAHDERMKASPALAGSEAWASIGLFGDHRSARESFDAGIRSAHWAEDASEVWSGLLQPFNHRGAVDWLNPQHPGQIYDTSDAAAPTGAFVVLTTVGWHWAPDLDMNRVEDFAAGVDEVLASMTGIDGLHSRQAFGAPDADPFTCSFWRDDAAMRAFAYRPGVHKAQMDRYRRLHTADRTSFTRFRVLDSSGTWCGTDPLAW